MTKIDIRPPQAGALTLEPYTPNIGAVIHDLDLREIAAKDVRAALRWALAEYQVLFFLGQDLSPEEQIAVAQVFGDPDKAKSFFPRHGEQQVIEVIEAKPGGDRYRTNEWHADITFSENPPTGTVLHARHVPPVGGDTVWASATRVYDLLDPSLQAYLETLTAAHSIEHSGWPDHFLSKPDGDERYRKARSDYLPALHPVIRTHPVTGRKLVYVNPNFTSHIKGLSRQESDALLSYLFGLFQKPEVQARLRWDAGTVAIWDNRATVHYAVSDYEGEHRLMHRVTFGEDAAF
jgi:taurine dioxygenase